MLTSRPFDEIIERSQNGGSLFTKHKKHGRPGDEGDKAMIRGYAQKYFADIIAMLDTVPRQMLLLFKMNDCLRHVDYALDIPPTNSLVVAGRFAALAVLKEEMRHPTRSMIQRVSSVVEYVRLLFRIQAFELITWWSTAMKKWYGLV